MIKWIKKIFCKHSHAWEFYPSETYFNKQKVHDGLKITACWECSKIIKVENYGQ